MKASKYKANYDKAKTIKNFLSEKALQLSNRCNFELYSTVRTLKVLNAFDESSSRTLLLLFQYV